MKTRIAVSTFALLAMYGVTPALAEPFNDRGPDIRNWPAASSTPLAQTGAGSSTVTPYQRSGFNKASNLVVAPSTTSSTNPASATSQRCDLSSPRIGFQQSSQLDIC